MALLSIGVPPRLPNAPPTYEHRFHDQHSDVLRLYFNQLGGALRTLSGPLGATHLNAPYAAVHSDDDVTFTANTATVVEMYESDFLNGVLSYGDGLIPERYVTGLFNYQYSIQFKNTDSQVHSAWVWLRVNDVDVAGTASKFDVIGQHGGIPGYIIGACNFYVRLFGEDIVQLCAAVSDSAVTFEAAPAQTTPFEMPSIPSVVATLTFVSFELP